MGNLIRTILKRPVLVIETLAAAWAFRSRRSLAPSRDLLAWRIATAYGTSGHPLETDDMVDFLEWRRAMRRAS